MLAIQLSSGGRVLVAGEYVLVEMRHPAADDRGEHRLGIEGVAERFRASGRCPSHRARLRVGELVDVGGMPTGLDKEMTEEDLAAVAERSVEDEDVVVVPDQWPAHQRAIASMFSADRAVPTGNATRCHGGNLDQAGQQFTPPALLILRRIATS